MTAGRAWQHAGWTVAGFAGAGALAATAADRAGVPLRTGELVALLFVSASLAAMVALLLPLRHATQARAVAALAAWAAVAAFFGAAVLLAAAPAARLPVLVAVGMAPAMAGIIAAGGATYLARAVRRSRLRRVPR